jgi:hypothetical protein
VSLYLITRPGAAAVHGTLSVNRRTLPFPDSSILSIPVNVSRTIKMTGVLEQYATSMTHVLELGSSGEMLSLSSSYLPPHGGRIFRWSLSSDMQLGGSTCFLAPGR